MSQVIVGTFRPEMDFTVVCNSLSQPGVAWVADATQASHIMPHVGSRYSSQKGYVGQVDLVPGLFVVGGITGS